MIAWISTDTELPEPGEYVIFWDREDKAARTGYFILHHCKNGVCRPARWISLFDSDKPSVLVPMGNVTHWAPLESIPDPNELSTEAQIQGVIDALKADREKCREWRDKMIAGKEEPVPCEFDVNLGAIFAYNDAIDLLEHITAEEGEA